MYKKKGFPKRNELVLCTVKQLKEHSAFMELDEYENIEGMLHSTELHRRWLRKWKSMLKPGTKTVCLVIDSNERNSEVNLSVKRVGEGQRINKLSEAKQEKTADGILTFFAKENKIKDIYKEVGNRILEEYGRLFPFLVDVSTEGSKLLTELGIEKSLAVKLADFVAKRIATQKSTLEGEIQITSYESNGIEVIKSILSEIAKLVTKHNAEVKLTYLGAPRYKFSITAPDTKSCDKAINEVKEFLEETIKNGEAKIITQR